MIAPLKSRSRMPLLHAATGRAERTRYAALSSRVDQKRKRRLEAPLTIVS